MLGMLERLNSEILWSRLKYSAGEDRPRRPHTSPAIWTGWKGKGERQSGRSSSGRGGGGDGANSVIDFLPSSYVARMGLIPELVHAVEIGFLLLFAFLCLLAFIIPFYCYHPYSRQRDVEDQDPYFESATQLPYSDDNTHSPR